MFIHLFWKKALFWSEGTLTIIVVQKFLDWKMENKQKTPLAITVALWGIAAAAAVSSSMVLPMKDKYYSFWQLVILSFTC